MGKLMSLPLPNAVIHFSCWTCRLDSLFQQIKNSVLFIFLLCHRAPYSLKCFASFDTNVNINKIRTIKGLRTTKNLFFFRQTRTCILNHFNAKWPNMNQQLWVFFFFEFNEMRARARSASSVLVVRNVQNRPFLVGHIDCQKCSKFDHFW